MSKCLSTFHLTFFNDREKVLPLQFCSTFETISCLFDSSLVVSVLSGGKLVGKESTFLSRSSTSSQEASWRETGLHLSENDSPPKTPKSSGVEPEKYVAYSREMREVALNIQNGSNTEHN